MNQRKKITIEDIMKLKRILDGLPPIPDDKIYQIPDIQIRFRERERLTKLIAKQYPAT